MIRGARGRAGPGAGRPCGGCGAGRLDAAVETLSVELPECGVAAAVVAPAWRCARCGGVRVDEHVLSRVQLVVGRALADGGVHTGDALRHMRRALGLRATDLARLLGVTPETISHWETGRAAVARAAFAAVAAMVHEALDGRTSTRDRLGVLAEGRPYPRRLTVSALPRRRRDERHGHR